MKTKNIFCLAFLFLFLGMFLQVASAEVQQTNYLKYAYYDSSGNFITTNTPVSDVKVYGIICADSGCNSASGELWGGSILSSSGSSINIIYPTTLLSPYGYGIYFVKEGYIPYEVTANWWGDITADSRDRYLIRKQVCNSSIISVEEDYSLGKLNVKSKVNSPILSSGPLGYVPPKVKEYYTANVTINTIIKQGANSISQQQKVLNLDYSSNKESTTSFSLNPGSYNLTVRTDATDTSCISSLTQEFTKQHIIIPYPDGDNDGYTSDVDCNDNNATIHPGVIEICGDETDNNCNGFVDEGCSVNSIPSLTISANTTTGYSPLAVGFSASTIGGDGTLSYSWIFGDGFNSILKNPTHVYDSSGSYTATCTVTDSDGDKDSKILGIAVNQQSLDVSGIICFENVVKGNNQSCSIKVRNNLNNPEPEAKVEVYYKNGQSFGNCTTDRITGMCSVKAIQNSVGNYSVYAIAKKTNYIPDQDNLPGFNYSVLEEVYEISNLKIYEDEFLSNERYEFFRGEDLFVIFMVKKNGVPVENSVTKATLVSPAGGRIDLTKIGEEDGWYGYFLNSIPSTHEFFGENQIFTFAFNFSDNSGGQSEITLNIRNNLPNIYPSISDQKVQINKAISLDLRNYENDSEDSGNDLRWEIISSSNFFETSLVGKNLSIFGKTKGLGEIRMRLYDLDNDWTEQTFKVTVEEKESSKKSSSSNQNKEVCASSWQCSGWSECYDGIQTRKCSDINSCFEDLSNPIEKRSCGPYSSSGKMAIVLNDSEKKTSLGQEIFLFTLPIILSLVCIGIIFALFLLLRKK